MGFIHILDDDDLELAGQEDDRQAGEQDQCGPRPGAARIQLQQPGHFRTGGGLLKEVGQAAEHAVGYENSDRQEGDQLDDGLEGHGGHHALVALRRIKVARSEQDGEQGKQCGDDEGRIEHAGQEFTARCPEQDFQARGNRFQLQRYVGHHANHRDHRDQTGEQLALAIARGDKIGNGGDPVHLADPDHLEDDTGHEQHQRRADIDCQERQTARSRAPHTAIEGPRGAVNSQRKRVDIGRNDRFPGIGPRVAETRDGEEQAHVERGQEEDKTG